MVTGLVILCPLAQPPSLSAHCLASTTVHPANCSGGICACPGLAEFPERACLGLYTLKPKVGFAHVRWQGQATAGEEEEEKK